MTDTSRWLFVLLTTLLAIGCGDCGEEPVGEGPGADGAATDGTDGDATGRDSMTPVDGADGDTMPPVDGATDGAADDSGDVSSRCPDGQRLCDGSCIDVRKDPTHCGACGTTCSGKEVCTDGDCVCPRYHERCNGSCVPTHIDPDNCGSCGNACAAGEVCSAGSCADSCLPGRTECGRRCVDTTTDPDNCGACGQACADGEGCLEGRCEPAIEVGDAPAKCAGGGPQIGIQTDRENERRRCLGNVAQNVFRWAMCSCDELVFDDELRTDAYDSSLGRYRPGGLGGSVGTNDRLTAGSDVDVRGALWTSGDRDTVFDDAAEIHQQLHVGGSFDVGSASTVRKDGFVEGDVVADSGLEFRQTLQVRPQSSVSEGVTYGKLERKSFDVATACERCDQTDRIPVKSIVSAHAGDDANDNDAIGLDADVLSTQGDKVVLVLPCGEYYLSELNIDDEATILAQGRTAVYIDGDVDVGSNLTMKATPSGELDVFVAGNVTLDDGARIGDPAYPASTRFYVGGQQGWKVGSNVRMGAYIYTIPGGLVADDAMELFGGLYTQDADVGSAVDVHYDRAVLDAGKNCTSPDPDRPNPNLDAGTGDSGMGDGGSDSSDSGASDADAGDGTPSMCAKSGESCGSDGDCCVPLVCGAAGTCDVKECRAQNESCSENDDCCSGSCAQVSGDAVCVGS